MIKKYRFCFLGFFVFALLSVYGTDFGSLLSIILSLIAFMFFVAFLCYFLRVKLIALSLLIKEIRNMMR